MTAQATQSHSSRVSRIIKAPRHAVYQAFVDEQIVARWLAPGSMQIHVHHFEPHVGGTFRISLTYQNPADAGRGKTESATDTYHGRFVALIPDEKVVEAIEFESNDPGLAGEMTMTVLLAPEMIHGAEATELTLIYENVPPAIRAEDNEEGARQSLAKLAALLE